MATFKDIEVKVLDHNLDKNMPLFLGMLTQRGHKISDMFDLEELYNKTVDKPFKEDMLRLCKSHSTIARMNYVTIAIVGLSTKCLTQLRTHAKRVTCISTSTQYSEYSGRSDNYLTPKDNADLQNAYECVNELYKDLLNKGIDKDTAGYILPQGLRKAFIMHANIDDWSYILRTRMCRRNTEECAYVARLIYEAIKAINPIAVTNALPACCEGPCTEGKMSCKQRFLKSEFGYHPFENQLPEVPLI